MDFLLPRLRQISTVMMSVYVQKMNVGHGLLQGASQVPKRGSKNGGEFRKIKVSCGLTMGYSKPKRHHKIQDQD